MAKGKTWKDKLTKKERKHLSDSGIRTKTQMEVQVVFLKNYEEENKDNPKRALLYPCWECKQIAKKLGMWGE
ncbi:hypothetical protein KAU43_07515 [candidate division WOR-3 bacterium]|nr:hypothetical protein [candidate division WOR-3 bacterium]